MASADMSERWPLHPTPWEIDLLTRWVRQIAHEYGVSYHAFCQRVLKLGRDDADLLNDDPSDETLEILAKGSGLTIERLRQMTWAGMIKRRNEIIEQAFRDDPEGMELMVKKMRDAIKKPLPPENGKRS